MSRLHLIILWVLTLVAGAIVFSVQSKESKAIETKTTLEQGSQVFEEIDYSKVGGLKLTENEVSTTLSIKGDRWGVTGMEHFPADVLKLRAAFDQITQLKIAQGIPATAEYYDRFGLDPEAEKKENRPRQISILDAEGKLIRTIFIGKQRESTGASASGDSGRFVRFSGDDSGIYVVDEDFYFFDSTDRNWLKKDFITIARPLEISADVKNDDNWKITRSKKSDDFVLEGITDKQKTISNVSNPLKTLFNGGKFNDLLTEEQAKEKREEAESRTISIKTEDLASYEFTLWPEKKTETAKEEKKDDKKKTDDRNYIVTFKITGDPKPPTDPGKEASEEEKAAFQAAMINFKSAPERVATNKLYADRFYLLPNASVKPLLIARKSMYRNKPQAPPKPVTPVPPAGTNPASKPPKASAVSEPIAVPPRGQSQPAKPPKKIKKRFEAVTPPIAIPPTPKAGEPKKADPPKKPETPQLEAPKGAPKEAPKTAPKEASKKVIPQSAIPEIKAPKVDPPQGTETSKAPLPKEAAPPKEKEIKKMTDAVDDATKAVEEAVKAVEEAAKEAPPKEKE